MPSIIHINISGLDKVFLHALLLLDCKFLLLCISFFRTPAKTEALRKDATWWTMQPRLCMLIIENR